MESRSLPVPDGLDGLARRRRARQAARLLAHLRRRGRRGRRGQPRRRGRRQVRPAARRRLARGQLERRSRRRRSCRSRCPTSTIVHDDDDIVVIDKPAGVAAHPSRRLGGPHRARRPRRRRLPHLHLRAPPSARASCTASTPAPAASWSSRSRERAYTELKRAFHDREVEKIYHAVVQGHPDPLAGTIDAPIGRHPSSELEVRRDRRRQALGHPLRDARGVPAAHRCSRSTWRPGARTRSACTWPPSGIPASATPMYGADPTLLCPARPRRGSGCTPCSSASTIRRPGSGSASRPSTPPTCNTHSTCSPP